MNPHFYLPQPDDPPPAPLKPTKRIEGTYWLHREPFDTDVKISEPAVDGRSDSYVVNWHALRPYLLRVLKLPEVSVDEILPSFWNFCDMLIDLREMRWRIPRIDEVEQWRKS